MTDDFMVEQYQGVDILCSTGGYYAWVIDRRFGGETRCDVREAIDDFMDSDDHKGWES